MNYTSGMVLSVMINTLLENNPSDTNPAEISELHYYRALALGR